MKEKIYLQYGDCSNNDECDYIIGDKKGLEVLRTCIDKALENGEADIEYINDAAYTCYYHGVKCYDTQYFKERKEKSDSFIIGPIVFGIIIGIFIAGLITIANWVFN